jgi:hypothetical protein
MRASTHIVNVGAYACSHARSGLQIRVSVVCVLARITSNLGYMSFNKNVFITCVLARTLSTSGHMRVSTHALVSFRLEFPSYAC